MLLRKKSKRSRPLQAKIDKAAAKQAGKKAGKEAKPIRLSPRPSQSSNRLPSPVDAAVDVSVSDPDGAVLEVMAIKAYNPTTPGRRGYDQPGF
jgi:hypothetical protein